MIDVITTYSNALKAHEIMVNSQITTQRWHQILKTLVILSVAWVYMGAPDYLHNTYPQTPQPAMFAIAMLAVISVYSIFMRCSQSSSDHSKKTWLPADFFRTRSSLFLWMFCFIVLAWLSLHIHGANSVATEDLTRRISATIFLCALLVLVSEKNTRNAVLIGMVIGALCLSVTIYLGTLRIAFFSPGYLRMGGLYLNANGAAYALVCALWVGSQIIHIIRWRNVFQTLILIALLMTMSRSGLIAAAFIMLALCYQRKAAVLKLTLNFTLLAIIAIGAIWYQGGFHPDSIVTKNLQARLDIDFKTEAGSSEIQLSGAAGERAQLAQDAIERFTDNIWLGSGVNPVGGEQSHNELLSFAAKHGVLGILLFLAFWVVCLRAGLPIGLAAGFFIIAMFDHSFFYARYILLTLACALDFKGWNLSLRNSRPNVSLPETCAQSSKVL